MVAGKGKDYRKKTLALLVSLIHMLNKKLDPFIWAPCAQLYSLAELRHVRNFPPLPQPPAFRLTRALLVSKHRRHLFVTPWPHPILSPALYCRRPIQCLASSKILTPHPLTTRRVCVPPAFGAGEDTLAKWRGGGGSIFWKTPETALYSTYVKKLCISCSLRG